MGPLDWDLSLVDEDEIGAGKGLDEAELAEIDPVGRKPGKVPWSGLAHDRINTVCLSAVASRASPLPHNVLRQSTSVQAITTASSRPPTAG